MATMTAAQICNLARSDAKVPGYTQQSGALLNYILSEMCTDYDWDQARTVVPLALNNGFGPYDLPADYLRVANRGLFYVIDNVPYFPVSIDLAEMDMLSKQAGVNGFPTSFATDMALNPPGLYIWPAAGAAYMLTIRYFRQMPDIATPESSATVPWFPNTNYLRTRLAAELMKLTDDTRLDSFLAQAADILENYQKMIGDRENRAQQVQLDRRRFGAGMSNLPNTKLIGW